MARIASRAISPQGSDVYRIDDPAIKVQVWQKAVDLKYTSSCHPGAQARGDIDGRMRIREGKIHCGNHVSSVSVATFTHLAK